ncbi:MAG: COX15/CtaA family protein [Gemmatimonadaceae bacterium]
MKDIRNLAWVSLALAFGHIVFGAIVRITGSGMGCGDHWPRCHGYWFPPLQRTDLIIEVSHRYFAATLSLAIVALLVITFARRRLPGVPGANGVLRPVIVSAVLVIAAALFGAVVVKLELTNKLVIVTHLSIAMALLGSLLVAIVRAGGPPRLPEYAAADGRTSSIARAGNLSTAAWSASASSARGGLSAAALAFSALVFGALTAHIPGANSACQGFPLCAGGLLPTSPTQHLQYVHRIIAFLLFFQLIWLALAAARRGEARVAKLAQVTVGLCLLQILIAAMMVELQLPPVWRSLHEAAGTLLWIVVFLLAIVTRRASLAGAPASAPGPTGRTVASLAGSEARA